MSDSEDSNFSEDESERSSDDGDDNEVRPKARGDPGGLRVSRGGPEGP